MILTTRKPAQLNKLPSRPLQQSPLPHTSSSALPAGSMQHAYQRCSSCAYAAAGCPAKPCCALSAAPDAATCHAQAGQKAEGKAARAKATAVDPLLESRKYLQKKLKKGEGGCAACSQLGWGSCVIARPADQEAAADSLHDVCAGTAVPRRLQEADSRAVCRQRHLDAANGKPGAISSKSGAVSSKLGVQQTGFKLRPGGKDGHKPRQQNLHKQPAQKQAGLQSRQRQPHHRAKAGRRT